MTEPQPFTTPPGWHVAADDLRSYASGGVYGVSADSIEAHLLRCDHCRVTLNATVRSDDRDRRWDAIAARVDQPGRWSRHATWFRVALGTPHLALAAVLLAVVFVALPLLAGLINERATISWFVALAPAVPIAAAVLAYATVTDPAGDTGVATPLHSFRLVVLRTAMLLAALLPVGLITSVLLPVRTALVLGWFVPAVAACLVVLAVGARYDPVWVAGALAAAWAGVVLIGFASLRHLPMTSALEQLSVNQPAVQVGSLVVALAATGWFAIWRDGVTYRVSP